MHSHSRHSPMFALQRKLKGPGVAMITEADESMSGPASFMVADPDGDTMLVDQHV